MKKNIKYLAILSLAMIACEPEFENSVKDGNLYTQGTADFSTYVAVGNSLTAGYADGALYIEGQKNSFPNILAQQFAEVGGGDFNQPLMADNLGGMIISPTVQLENRLILKVGQDGKPSPVRVEGTPTTVVSNILTGPFNNMGVPGAKSFHLLAQGYGNIAGLATGKANPYFVRFASSPSTSVIADAVAQNPTFFSLWIGANDVLSYATSGGIGVNQTGNMDPTTYGGNDITDPTVFAGVYSQLVTALTANGAKGILVNIPDVKDAPFFTTVPNNALVLDATQAAQLTGVFQAVAGILTIKLITAGVPAAQAQALAAQYAIKFNEGNNRFIIDVPASPTNPLGFRQMTEEELVLLTINTANIKLQGYGTVALTPEVLQVLGILQQGGQITPTQAQMVIAAVNGFDDKDVLISSEIQNIETATTAYNTTIEALAQANSLAFLDANALLDKLANTGITEFGVTLTEDFGTGGAFSLDGVHLTPRGYAFIADQMIKEINATYDAKIPLVNISAYRTVALY